MTSQMLYAASSSTSGVIGTLIAILAVLSTLAAGLSTLAVRRYERADGAEETLEARLDRVARLMRESSQLLERTKVEIDARAENAHRLKEQADDAQAVIELTAAEREAVARLVRTEVTQESARSLRKSLLLNALFFVAGSLVSLAIVLFVHPL